MCASVAPTRDEATNIHTRSQVAVQNEPADTEVEFGVAAGFTGPNSRSLRRRAQFGDRRPDRSKCEESEDHISRLASVSGGVLSSRRRWPIKIGYSASLKLRVPAVATKEGKRVRVLGYLPGGRTLERELQKRLNHLHREREWFRGEKALLDFAVTHTRKVAPHRAGTL